MYSNEHNCGIAQSVEELIGRTPMLRLNRVEKELGLKGRLLCKLEGFNPGGSAKDRAACRMLLAAEEAGEITPGGTVIEPTSGNTGISLAMLCAARGYRAVIVMPDSASAERVQLMRAYGAQVSLTPGADGMLGAVNKAREMAAHVGNAFIPSQFDNAQNARAHYMTTGLEIWAQTGGDIDMLVCGVGTGGTITGTGRFLKEKKPGCLVIAVEPAASPLLSQGWAGAHKIQGIGANFVPALLDIALLDRVVTVSDQSALDMAARLAAMEGVLAGISSGAAVAAAVELLREQENSGKTAVVVLPDTGERYLSCMD